MQIFSHRDNSRHPERSRPRTIPGQMRQAALFCWHVGRRTLHRYQEDGCNILAASLSYTILLALVPLLVVGLGMLAAFPAFEGMREKLLDLMLSNMVPDVGTDFQQGFTTFINNAGGMTGAGILGLAVTSVMLLNSLQRAFAVIWRTPLETSLVKRLPVYWAVLTLGPLLFGVSLSLSGYLFATLSRAGALAGGNLGQELVHGALQRLPLLFAICGFALLYKLMPARVVKTGHALAGGVLAALLFELGKTGFALYVRAFPSWQVIYGALAAVPVFFVWVYISLSITLIGAELAATLGEGRRRQAGEDPESGVDGADAWARLAASLCLLECLYRQGENGGEVTADALQQAADPWPAAALLTVLLDAGYIVETGNGGYVLARDMARTRFGDLLRLLEIWPASDQLLHTDEARAPLVRAARALGELRAVGQEVADRPLVCFLGSDEETATESRPPEQEAPAGQTT